VDSAAYADAVIPPYYDSMIAKLIVKGPRSCRGRRANEARSGNVRDRRDQDVDSVASVGFWPTRILPRGKSILISSNGLLGTKRKIVLCVLVLSELYVILDATLLNKLST